MTRKNRRKPARPVAAGPGAGAPLAPDELVFGSARQLRDMAESLRRRDPSASAMAQASARRIQAYRDERHIDADRDLSHMHGRPRLDVPVPVGPVWRPQAAVSVRAATDAGPAELWVSGSIEPPNPWGEGVSAERIREQLDAIGPHDVIVHLASGGGDYFEGIDIYRALRNHPANVYSAIDSLAASAASVVAMAGDTIGIGYGAHVMIHEAASFAYGNAEDMLRIAAMLESVDSQISGFYARRPNASTDAEGFRELMKAETWADPDKALELGLADERLASDRADNGPAEDEDSGEDDDIDPAVAALFDFARPANTIPAPAADPAPVPEPTPADWSTLFRDDMEDLFA